MPHAEPTKPFGVVCHDAGGANQISAMILRFDWRPDWVMVKGPAAAVWERDFPEYRIASDFSAMGNVNCLLTGTGWASNLEHEGRIKARELGIQNIAILDHWTNYETRFTRAGHVALPDTIWVVDEYAELMAQSIFRNMPIVRQIDCFAARELEKIVPISVITPNVLLYLLEPIRSYWGRQEFGEFQALRYFLQQLPSLGLDNLKEIRLRPHPSEDTNKYKEFLRDNGSLPIYMSECTLAEAISNSQWVAGCQTYAMTLALKAGRQVFSTLPPWAPPKVLPHQKIQYLRELIS